MSFLLSSITRVEWKESCLRKYGVDGEFYVEGDGFKGQDDDNSVVDHNSPPSTQPGLWCQWTPNKDGTAIVWDENEKFYDYVTWLQYIVKNFLAPKGYILNGAVEWTGEEHKDTGKIIVTNNIIEAYRDDEYIMHLEKKNAELEQAVADLTLLT